MIARAAARLARSGRGRAWLLVAALLGAALLAFAPGDLGPTAARAALAAAALAAAVVLVGRRARPPAAAPLTIVGRELLAAGAGLALVEVAGRRLLVGFARDGVRLVLDLGAPLDGGRP